MDRNSIRLMGCRIISTGGFSEHIREMPGKNDLDILGVITKGQVGNSLDIFAILLSHHAVKCFIFIMAAHCHSNDRVLETSYTVVYCNTN